MSSQAGLSGSYSTWQTGRAIAQGYLSTSTKAGHLPSGLQGLKTLYIAQPDVLPADVRISSNTLSKLRLLLSARVCLALTTGRVGGFVAQTGIYDYRDKGGVSCVGCVASSLELWLVGEEEEMGKSNGAGRVSVRGPAVVGGRASDKVTLDVVGRVDGDNTVVLV